jgi:hypothetical protein
MQLNSVERSANARGCAHEWTQSNLEGGDVLEVACAKAGLDCTDAVLLRGHTNAVIRLIRDPVVVKIARRGTRPSEVARTVQFVRWLMGQGSRPYRYIRSLISRSSSTVMQ